MGSRGAGTRNICKFSEIGEFTELAELGEFTELGEVGSVQSIRSDLKCSEVEFSADMPRRGYGG